MAGVLNHNRLFDWLLADPEEFVQNEATSRVGSIKLIIAAVAAGIGILGVQPSSPGNTTKTSSRCTPGRYRLVESRASIRVIFVEPACNNLEAMTALGIKLRTDFAAESMVTGLIFDNLRAAKMYDRMLDSGGTIGVKEDRFYDEHNIGSYSKNVNTGFDQYLFTPRGGHQVQITY